MWSIRGLAERSLVDLDCASENADGSLAKTGEPSEAVGLADDPDLAVRSDVAVTDEHAADAVGAHVAMAVAPVGALLEVRGARGLAAFGRQARPGQDDRGKG